MSQPPLVDGKQKLRFLCQYIGGGFSLESENVRRNATKARSFPIHTYRRNYESRDEECRDLIHYSAEWENRPIRVDARPFVQCIDRKVQVIKNDHMLTEQSDRTDWAFMTLR